MTVKDRLARIRRWPLVVSAIGSAALGVLAGGAPLTGVEPGGNFVDCGPAVFGRPSPLPDVSCGQAYNQLPVPMTFLTFFLIVLSVALVIAAVGVEWVHRQARRSRIHSVHAQTQQQR